MSNTNPHWVPQLASLAPAAAPNAQPTDALVHRNEFAQSFVQVVPVGGLIRAHRHTGTWDYFIGLSGTAQIALHVGSETARQYDMEPGGFLAVPPNTTHQIRCSSEEPFVFFLFQAPYSAYDYITEPTS